MTVQFISIDKDNRWQHVKAKEIAAMIGKPVYVTVQNGPGQTQNPSRVHVGVFSSVHFRGPSNEPRTSLDSGSGHIRFADATLAGFERYDVIIITVIEQEG